MVLSVAVEKYNDTLLSLRILSALSASNIDHHHVLKGYFGLLSVRPPGLWGRSGAADLDAQQEVLQLGRCSRRDVLVLLGAAVVC